VIDRCRDRVRQHLRSWLLSPEELERLATPIPTAEPPPLEGPEKPFDPLDPDNWVSLDYIEEVLQDRMERQSDAWDLVDGRLRLILGVVGIIFAAVLGFQRGATQLDYHVTLLVNLAVLLFLMAGIIAAIAYWPGDFNWPPDPEDFRRYLTTDPRRVKLWLVDSLIYRGYNRNEVYMLWKGRAFRASFVLTVLAVAALAAALMNHIMGQSKDPNCTAWIEQLQSTCDWLQSTQQQLFPRPSPE
jgi:hypothetical protein